MSRAALWRPLAGIVLAAWVTGCALRPDPDLDGLARATVLIEHAKGHGTGIILGPRQILTAYHVVTGGPVAVVFYEGPAVGGRVAWYDEKLDLALIDAPVPQRYRATALACADLRVGQRLVAVGHPMRARWVAAAGRLPTVTGIGGLGLVPLGFDLGLGSSGGPVFDQHGRVVGVTLAILAERRSTSAGYDEFKSTGIGLMLPATAFCAALGPLGAGRSVTAGPRPGADTRSPRSPRDLVASNQIGPD
jgi:serine protease Do